MINKICVFLLSLSICFTPSLVFASSSVDGWSMGSGVSKGASTVYEGTKSILINGKDFLKKGTATVLPTANDVAKTLAKGAGGYALVFAVEQLLGAVDWVLDPVNNEIVYKEKILPNDPSMIQGWITGNISKTYFYSDQQACSAWAKKIDSSFTARVTGSQSSISSICTAYDSSNAPRYNTNVQLGNNPYYDPTAESKEDERRIPLTTVADKVISNADSGNADAQAVTRASADAVVQDAVNDKTGTKARPITQQLEQSSTRTQEDAEAQAQADTATGTQTQNPDKPNVTDLTLEFPAFCGWAPIVCEAAQVAISFPTTVSDWVTEAKEWVKEEPETDNDDNEIEVEVPEEFDMSVFSKDRFSVSKQCPVPEQHTLNVSGMSVNFSFDLTPVCQVLEFARPALIACSYLYAAYIVIGASRNG